MNIDVISQVAKLTTIDELPLKRIAEKQQWCLSDAIEQAILNGDKVVEADIGFGTIVISIFDSAVKYKFIPSKTTDEQVINTIVNGRNQLTFELEKNLVAKITNIYKDML